MMECTLHNLLTSCQYPQVFWIYQMNDYDENILLTKGTKQEMDLLAGFLEQCIEIDYENDERIMASDLFGLYSKWAKRNNEYEMTSKKFFREVSKKLPEKGRCGKGIYYSNIRLTEYAEELEGVRQYNWQSFN